MRDALKVAEKKVASARTHGQKGDVKKAQYELDKTLNKVKK